MIIDHVFGKYTKSSRHRLTQFKSALKYIDAQKVAGDIVECGVWRGGNIMLARMVAPQRVCWLYDTFTGMPKPGPYDMKRDGTLAQEILDRKKIAMSRAPLDEVVQGFRDLGLFDERYLKFIVGNVEHTLLAEENLPKQIALLRLDTDWYESTKVELEILYPRLVKGGVLIVDDYGHWQGCRKAVDDYFPDDIRMRFKRIDYTAISFVK
jgi:O-methyltransferase